MNYLNFNCNIEIKDNPLNLNIADYLDIALRNNNKRRFLFISKSLGKHMPISPQKIDELGELIARVYKLRYEKYRNHRQIVIGFAETATCLSHSFFNYLDSVEFFTHTTREKMNLGGLEFQEEHSHATDQNLYIDDLQNVHELDSIILVDDEITTANTCLNIIKQLQKIYDVDKYIIASILNWIDEDRKKEIEREATKLNCSIEFVYLFNGRFEFELNEEDKLKDSIEECTELLEKPEINTILLDFLKYIGDKKYVKYTGRFGITRKEHNKLKEIIRIEALKLKPKYTDCEILALGTEEFMYIPMMLSKEIEGDVYYHSTTRSPIIPINNEKYPIRKKYRFKSFYNENMNYVYNLNSHYYRECFVFIEYATNQKKIDDFVNILANTGIKRINIVRF